MFFHLPQRNLRPLCKPKSLLSPKGLLNKTKIRPRSCICLTCHHNTQMTYRQNLNHPEPGMPRSSTTIWALNDEKGQQELRPTGPSAMLPLSPDLKDALEKFEQAFQAANLPESTYIKPPSSTSKWYKLGQPCFEDNVKN